MNHRPQRVRVVAGILMEHLIPQSYDGEGWGVKEFPQVGSLKEQMRECESAEPGEGAELMRPNWTWTAR